MDDAGIVTRQLGRVPRGVWRVAARCSFGRPTAIATAPALPDGAPFPTLFYLTCPHLVECVGELESAGAVRAWRQRLATDPALAAELDAAASEYRQARLAEGAGEDPARHLGIAGVREAADVKCLHAHVAARLAGIDDPIGREVLAALVRECEQDRCGEGR